MRTTKKFVSVFLALCMLGSTTAMSAMAATTDAESVSGGSIAVDNAATQALEELDAKYRYNGNEFYLMNSIKSIKTVRCLYVDNENRLFVGTNDEGLSILINENVANVIDEDDGLPLQRQPPPDSGEGQFRQYLALHEGQHHQGRRLPVGKLHKVRGS